MISRALLTALFSAYVSSLSPLAPIAAPADDDCALYLTGPGRSSAYDYSLNLLKGNFAYDGQHTCITYEAINQAYLDARTRILVSQPKGDWHAEDFASVGELILDISISLARTYGLTYEEIEKGLPLIDTSRTLIREVCPPVFSHVECRAGKYRRLDGLCNNLQHPTWGATMAPFQRLIGPLFADGINAPRIAHTGRDLPLSRVVSRTMHTDEGYHDHAGTVMVIAWGQFMDHDYTLTGTPLDPINRNDPEECCKRPPHLKHPYCNEIRIPDDDYFYRLFGVKCIDFVRGFPSPRPGCKLGSRVPFNTLTGAIDGNTVYGVTEKFARKLRTGYGGLLRMNPVFKEYGLKDLLPLKLDIPDEGCTRPNKNMYCFEAGEIRVNEQLVLTVMHTLMAREHNRVAKALAEVNPHWDDETLFQEARRINIAEIQHITYNEFLPILLGKDVMEKFGLVLQKEGYWDGYDPEVNPDVIDAFASAAYRFGHSLLPTAVERWSKAHKFIASKRLSDLIRRPYDLYRAGVLDEYVMGLMNQVAQAMDDSITQEVTNHLFKKVGARFGMDLVSFNMQRGREFGIPGYMEFRKFCGLSDAHNFLDLIGSMPNETLRKFESIFEHPIDIDLWSGGVSERPLRGSMLGPTFACIIATQFSYSRRGDRFWFELPNQPSSFTPEQLTEIRKSRLARIICDNTDIIDTVQLYPMVLPDHELNPRVPCRSGILPSMDFSKWAEPIPFSGPAKQYITDAKILNQTAMNITENDILYKNDSGVLENDKSLAKEKTFTKTNKYILDNSKLKKDKNNSVGKTLLKENNLSKLNKKSSGHEKNMLRKRRAAPFIYSYVTHHDNPESKIELKTDEFVKDSNLAEFNIETLHGPEFNYSNGIRKPIQHKQLRPLNNKELSDEDEGDYHNKKYNNSQSQEIDESGESNTSNQSQETEYSRDKNYKSNSKIKETNSEEQFADVKNNHPASHSLNNSGSEEYGSEERNYRPITTNRDYQENTSSEDSEQGLPRKYKESPYKPNLESDISTEKYTIPKSEQNIPVNSEYINSDEDRDGEEVLHYKPRQLKQQKPTSSYNNDDIDSNSRSDESTENDKYLQRKKTDDRLSTQNSQSNESGEDHRNSSEESKNSDSSSIQENSNELNQEGYNDNRDTKTDKIELRDINESNEEPHNSEKYPILPQNNEKLYKDDLNSSDVNSLKIKNINDDAIKPVIELNNEDESNESQEESALSGNLKNSIQQINRNLNGEKVDLKQQVERIPLDYKHTEVNTEKTDGESKDIPILNNSSKIDIIPTLSTSEDDKLDANLNIKFSDISIKLPEIKLPEDILAFDYEEPERKIADSEDESKEGESDDDKTSYDNYYDYPSHYNEKVDDRDEDDDDKGDGDEDEDLYEKFVRERFGKRRPKKGKSKNAKYIVPDKKLYSTLKNVLKRTEKIQQEAAKSGDPKAGYAWTLEYGQKL